MKIFPFQAWYPNFDLIASPDSFFGSLKEEYRVYKKTGFFNQVAQEAIFFYQIKSADRSYIGLMCCTDIEEYDKGNIKKHENTMVAKEQKMIQLLMERKALVKPVLLVYSKVNKINNMINRHIKKHKPLYSTQFEDKEEHFLWKINDPALIAEAQQLFASQVHTTYIADGHHRTTTAALLNDRLKDKEDMGNYEQLMVVLFGSDQLDLLEYNRVVEGLNDCSPTLFMAKLSQLFDIKILKKPKKPQAKHQITLFINQEWYLLKWKKSVLKEFKAEEIILDVALMNDKILKDIIGIKNVRLDQRITYVPGSKGLYGLEKETRKSKHRIGFYLYPVQMSELMALADDELLLPPKSTYFEPRIKNGLLVKSLE